MARPPSGTTHYHRQDIGGFQKFVEIRESGRTVAPAARCPIYLSEPECALAFTFSMVSSGFGIVGLLGLISLSYVMLVVTDNFKEKPPNKWWY
jgi:hypothetical protein